MEILKQNSDSAAHSQINSFQSRKKNNKMSRADFFLKACILNIYFVK